MITSKMIYEFLGFIRDDLVDKHGLDEHHARTLLESSNVFRMIFVDPEYIMHYDSEDLADDIIKESSIVTR